MTILISPETDIHDEIDLLNEMFRQGLTHFHLRKPNKSSIDLEKYLERIDSKYLKNVVMHLHHDLVEKKGLRGYHFQEQARLDLGTKADQLIRLHQSKGYSCSSSFHEPADISACTVTYDYRLLSPVFSSISKQGYEGRGFAISHIHQKIVGMGGVDAENIEKIKEMGYGGIGVLGGVWNASDPVEAFVRIYNKAKQVFND